MRRIILTASLFVAFFACPSPKVAKYEVIDSFIIDSTNVLMFTVFTPDTNWIEMQKFAEKLTEKATDPQRVGVGFFNPKEKTPRFLRPSPSIGTACMPYIVATYNYDKSGGKLILHKGKNPRTNKEMHFE